MIGKSVDGSFFSIAESSSRNYVVRDQKFCTSCRVIHFQQLGWWEFVILIFGRSLGLRDAQIGSTDGDYQRNSEDSNRRSRYQVEHLLKISHTFAMENNSFLQKGDADDGQTMCRS